MTYSVKYNTNPSFPYSPNSKKNFSISNILSPFEKLIGKKLKLEDLLLIGIIYIIFTEKDKENYILILCLLFILID